MEKEKIKKQSFMWFFVALRLTMSFIFLWAFFDKLFGLGFATKSGGAWINGISPTTGFLTYGTKGIFSGFFHTLSGNVVIDWLFMLGLLCTGAGLLTGIFVTLASYLGVLLMILIWLSLFPPQNHPFIDEHIVYIIVLVGLSQAPTLSYAPLGRWWRKSALVKRFPFLR